MSSVFYDDDTARDAFFQGRVEPAAATSGEIVCIDWNWTGGNETAGVEHAFQPEQEVLQPAPQLRIVLAPLDHPGSLMLRPLYDRYNIPIDFIRERLHQVSYGSGSQTSPDGVQSSWFHYLCKSIDIASAYDDYLEDQSSRIVDYHDRNFQNNDRTKDQSNWTWLKSSFYLQWVAQDIPSTTGQTEERQELRPVDSVTLICFGASPSLAARFRRLKEHQKSQSVLRDPYTLLTIAFDETFREMDQQAWNLGSVFRGIEKTILKKAREIHTNSTRYDFVGLYNITKHCIYLREAFDAALETIADVRSQHKNNQRITQSADKDATQSRLAHHEGLLKSAKFRLESLNSRIQSITSLSFNLVTQQDSRVMWQDNQTMKAIAMITLFFLPMATVGTVFGCQFFGLDSSTSPPTFLVAPQIWILAVTFAVAILLMFPMWKVAHLTAEKLKIPSPDVNGTASLKKNKLPWRFWATSSSTDGHETIELRSIT